MGKHHATSRGDILKEHCFVSLVNSLLSALSDFPFLDSTLNVYLGVTVVFDNRFPRS